MDKKKGDTAHFSQTLKYVLLHATKQGSEPHSINEESDETIEWFLIMETVAFTCCRRPPCTQQFLLLRTITQPTWDSSTKQFTKQYYKWLKVGGGELCQYNHRTREDRDDSQQFEGSNGGTIDAEDQSGHDI
eukprot:1733753-Amphidinium_carterae.1